MKQIITMPFNAVPGKLNSHKGAWAFLWKQIIEEETGHPCEVAVGGHDFSDHDRVYVYHGMEFKGGLNLFGGPDAKSALHISKFLDFKGEIVSLDVDMPLYGEMCRDRIYDKKGEVNPKVPAEWKDADWVAIDQRLQKSSRLAMIDLPREDVVFGDSHSFSAWQPGYKALRHDGQTLRGALKKGIGSFLPVAVRNLTVYLGNIDIRFHFGRQEDPFADIDAKIKELAKQLITLRNQGRITGEIELVTLLPIEDESRAIPGTGQFLKQNFFGTQAERTAWMTHFNEKLFKLTKLPGFKVFAWPEQWYVDTAADPLSFFDKMEKPRSVHLSREFYRWTKPMPVMEKPVKVKKVKEEKAPKADKPPKKKGGATADFLALSNEEVLALADKDVKEKLGNFIKEFNKREWSVRIGQTHRDFVDYQLNGYVHKPEFGYGFCVENKPVPYFHPNRSFHDEIIWLNEHLYFRTDVSFEDKLINSAIVKFYGPSRTLDIITGSADDIPYLVNTGSRYIHFDKMETDPEYKYTLMKNIEVAFSKGQKIWGTTELRTSLQTASRNFARQNPSPIDVRGVICPVNKTVLIAPNLDTSERKMRASDMIHWLHALAYGRAPGQSQGWIDFYKAKPTMSESYWFLNQLRGMGPYYCYHFSSNLCRMPGVGDAGLIEAEFKAEFDRLGVTHGKMDENADFVMAGPGACATLERLWPGVPINAETTTKMLLAIRDNQEDFYEIKEAEDKRYHKEATEMGYFTTFGCEIACCQFNVFTRLSENWQAAVGRANAPISMEVGGKSKMCSLDGLFAI
ncbi:hypothetical protein 44RRORF233c [Aeromonas phage 44RR2.8t]|uniref:Uncharacterized protein n=2 Tax=Biquartavirus 44RR2 TaxID=115987 RepID=Q6U969_9CAUD|nr:hypothetical protein ST44RRORF233c [Aeromonas phage 44RR2.8t]AAQ81551.1 hypothetical protein 44RRORF233c [Aeromonas phage 44RR2.8t]APU00705.1 hypothetical protein [Aeromonas phage 44RR2.8t.2]